VIQAVLIKTIIKMEQIMNMEQRPISEKIITVLIPSRILIAILI